MTVFVTYSPTKVTPDLAKDTFHNCKEDFSKLLNHPPVPEIPTFTSHSITNPDCPKNGKAPGLCSITAEMLKAGVDNINLWLTQIVNHVSVSEALLDDWRGEAFYFPSGSIKEIS